MCIYILSKLAEDLFQQGKHFLVFFDGSYCDTDTFRTVIFIHTVTSDDSSIGHGLINLEGIFLNSDKKEHKLRVLR